MVLAPVKNAAHENIKDGVANPVQPGGLNEPVSPGDGRIPGAQYGAGLEELTKIITIYLYTLPKRP